MHRSSQRRYSITSSASASSVERNVDAERLGGFHIDGHLKFGRLHNRQIGSLLTFENTGGINAGLTVCIGNAGRVAHQTAGSDIIAQVIDRGNSMSSRQSDNPFPTGVQEPAATAEQRASPTLDERSKGGYS
jgi:hypothetical protein